LSGCELAQGAVRPGCVVMLQVFVQHRRRWCSLTISNRSKSSRRSVPIIRLQTAFALGACGGLARIRMSAAWNTASNEAVNYPTRS
jgi:hypothetical protein